MTGTKHIFFLLFLLLSFRSLFSQTDEGSAVSIETLPFSSSSPSSCTLNNVTLSSNNSVASCSGASTFAFWTVFTAETQAVKINLSDLTFDGVIELLDASLNSLACVNNEPNQGDEALQYAGLTEGASYYVRVSSFNGSTGTFSLCAQHYPKATISDGWHPNPSNDDEFPGYKLNQNTKRNFIPGAQATRYYFEDIDTGETYFRQINSTTTNLILSSVNDICFGQAFFVTVEILFDNFWCGTSEVRIIQMEDQPFAQINPALQGSVLDLGSSISAIYMGPEQQFEWRFTTDGGNTVIETSSPGNSSNLLFNATSCLRYNRIYTVEVRAFYCGFWGPWSAPLFFSTSSVPYNKLRDQFCGATLAQNSFIQTEFAPSATGYIWQFAPIALNDPTFTPIGPAKVFTQMGATGLFINQVGISNNSAYRVAVKNIYSDCGTYQEGDYGEFCQIILGTPSALQARANQEDFLPDPNTKFDPDFGISLFPNPIQGQILNLEIQGMLDTEIAQIEVYDFSGRLVYDSQVVVGAGSSQFQMEFPSSLTTGTYMVHLRTENQVITSRFVKATL